MLSSPHPKPQGQLWGHPWGDSPLEGSKGLQELRGAYSRYPGGLAGFTPPMAAARPVALVLGFCPSGGCMREPLLARVSRLDRGGSRARLHLHCPGTPDPWLDWGEVPQRSFCREWGNRSHGDPQQVLGSRCCGLGCHSGPELRILMRREIVSVRGCLSFPFCTLQALPWLKDAPWKCPSRLHRGLNPARGVNSNSCWQSGQSSVAESSKKFQRAGGLQVSLGWK